MKWNFDSDTQFKKGERYHLVVDRAEDGESNEKGTPFLKIHLKTEAGEKAYDKTLWCTPKAAYRAKEWARAMGFSDEGDVDLDPSKMAGIHITAKADYRLNKDDGKHYLEWEEPESASGSSPAPAAQAAASAPEPEQSAGGVEEVPF